MLVGAALFALIFEVTGRGAARYGLPRTRGDPSPRLRAPVDAHEVRYEVAADKYALRHGATPADIAGALLAMLEHD